MTHTTNRRQFLRDLGVGAAAVPFLLNLPSLGFANQTRRKQRLVLLFSPNGVVQPNYLARRGGGEVHPQGEPQAVGAVQATAP